MALRLENKNALITGGASGIGRATAIRFAEEGANVFVADRHLAAAEETAASVKKLGRKAVAYQVDTSDEAQVNAMVAQMVKDLGSVNIVVAAAGISHAHYGEEGQPDITFLSNKSFANWRKVLSVNLDGVFLTDRACADAMIKAGNGGRIINIASAAARMPTPGVGEYSVSKAGVWMLTKVLAMELAPFNITANAIGPGFIKTPMTAQIQDMASFATPLIERVPMKRMGEPVDVANTALFLASEEGRYYTGSILHPDGGIVMQ
jgi:NAD(P)-dependent dehydrogenase (short-subunit alcohol dehydrogenase family)